MKKLTNIIVDEKLSDRNIKRIDNYTGNHIKINWICLICNYTWAAMPYAILNSKTGCPKCANKVKLTNEIIDQRFESRFTRND